MSDSVARSLAIAALSNAGQIEGELYVLEDDFFAEVARAKKEELKRAFKNEAVNSVKLILDSEGQLKLQLFDVDKNTIGFSNKIELPEAELDEETVVLNSEGKISLPVDGDSIYVNEEGKLEAFIVEDRLADSLYVNSEGKLDVKTLSAEDLVRIWNAVVK